MTDEQSTACTSCGYPDTTVYYTADNAADLALCTARENSFRLWLDGALT